MNKRRFIAFSLKAFWTGMIGTLLSLKSDPTSATYPPDIFKSPSIDGILLDLFETTEAVEDGGIQINIPLEAEHNGFIPFRISAPGAEKIVVIVDKNPAPLVLTAELSGHADSVVIGTLKLHQTSNVTCYALRQGQLLRSSRPVRFSTSGYPS